MSKNKKLFLLLLILTVLSFGVRVYQYKDSYIKPFEADYWQYRYDHSQWVSPSDCKNVDPHINPETCAWDDAYYAANKDKPFEKHEVISLGDDGLYTYVGWQLITGRDPSSVNAEVPPFGKYLIGLTTFIFHNQNIYATLMGAGVLISFYFLNLIIFKNSLYAIIPVFIFSLEPLFYEQLRAPFLDLQMLLFLLLVFIFFLHKRFILSSVMLGLFAATKAPFLAVIVVAACIVYLLVTKQRKELKKYLLVLPISLVAYLLCYSMYFVYGHSIKDFLSLQKWIISFYNSGAKTPFYGMVFPMIFAGIWYTWWGAVERVKEWGITWPILLVTSVFSFRFSVNGKSVLGLSVKTDNYILLIQIWVVVYLLFLIITPVWPRYLLLLLPFLYNLAVWVVLKVLQSKKINSLRV